MPKLQSPIERPPTDIECIALWNPGRHLHAIVISRSRPLASTSIARHSISTNCGSALEAGSASSQTSSRRHLAHGRRHRTGRPSVRL